MRPVIWSEGAVEDVGDALAYIALDNPFAADRAADLIEAAGESLGHMATGRKGRVSGTYERVIRNLPYILAYELRNEPDGTETIVILRVIHMARDWQSEDWPE